MTAHKATFAGGCFWCTQHAFNGVKGVISATAGYTGGERKSPSYHEVSQGTTGHVEAVELLYDPSLISYLELLKIYWNSINPLQGEGQFCDIGSEYRPLIFYHSEEQHREAMQFKEERLKVEGPSEVQIQPAKPFYKAEEYHQDYALKNPAHYDRYYYASGRAKKHPEHRS